MFLLHDDIKTAMAQVIVIDPNGPISLEKFPNLKLSHICSKTSDEVIAFYRVVPTESPNSPNGFGFDERKRTIAHKIVAIAIRDKFLEAAKAAGKEITWMTAEPTTNNSPDSQSYHDKIDDLSLLSRDVGSVFQQTQAARNETMAGQIQYQESHASDHSDTGNAKRLNHFIEVPYGEAYRFRLSITDPSSRKSRLPAQSPWAIKIQGHDYSVTMDRTGYGWNHCLFTDPAIVRKIDAEELQVAIVKAIFRMFPMLITPDDPEDCILRLLDPSETPKARSVFEPTEKHKAAEASVLAFIAEKRSKYFSK
jgi:hypothetical protein